MIEEVTSYLSTQMGLTLGTSLFANVLPETTGAAAAVYEHEGLPSVQRFGNNLPAYERPRLLVVTRSSAGAAGAVSSTHARTLAFKAWKGLTLVANTQLPSSTGTNSRYLRIEPVSSPFLLERDDRGRYVFGFYADVSRVATTNG